MQIFALLIIHWSSTIIIIMLLVSSFLWPSKKWISILLTIAIIARNILPLLDLEGRRIRNTAPINIVFLVQQNFILTVTTLFLNLWYESKIFTFSFNLFCVGFMTYGGFRISCIDDLNQCVKDVIFSNIMYFITTNIFYLVGIAFYMFLMFYFSQDSSKELLLKINNIQATTFLMENLEEAMIVVNEKGFQYFNNKGFEIIDEI